ncbi:MAG TPA: fibronectin type III domain-containing protein [Terriglobales bacterium]|jgi:fibronectin type 3 domain-containing protein|nr:fibronectin type III domain-containing protein [Terriglobales bacterium]
MNVSFKKWAGIAALVVGLLSLAIVGLAHLQRNGEPHSVTLTWQAARPVRGIPVVGYNVYRRASEATSFVRIATRVAGPPYEDRLVTSGRTYFYAVTSVDGNGRESRFSTAVTVEIP